MVSKWDVRTNEQTNGQAPFIYKDTVTTICNMKKFASTDQKNKYLKTIKMLKIVGVENFSVVVNHIVVEYLQFLIDLNIINFSL